MEQYNSKEIEKKWQEKWEEQSFGAEDFSNKKKFYCLIEFPYPSGDGLHVGHVRSYTAFDIIARKKRMEGYNILFPIGFDAFGLPTENYAIKNKISPIEATKKNIENFRRQLKSLGLSFDWDREISTTDPEYYKWTQWIFLQFFKHGLAYKTKMPINWCLSCEIGLANEEVVNGKCERCGGEVEKRDKEQWMLRITEYADKLDKDLDNVDYLERIKIQQKNWIGKSEGVEVNFKGVKCDINCKHPADCVVEDCKEYDIPVFTTRIDTIFGVTAMVLSPEHPLVMELAHDDYTEEVKKYIDETKNKTDIERTSAEREQTGVPIGASAINPISGEKVPIWIADYVLAYYGTGAVMSVPAHDERDFAFAKKHGLDIKYVIAPTHEEARLDNVYTGEGYLVNSKDFDGLTSGDARIKLADYVEMKECGKRQVNYHLRDWVFSRQRYWGEPIPLIHCEECGVVPVPEDELPVLLPKVERYEPTDTGESPLAEIESFVNVRCPKCNGKAKRETDTMPNWAGSSWYFLRYIDPKNNGIFADEKKLRYWLKNGGIDWYNGGMEHTTLHLLYSRFWYKFLFDIGKIPKECGSEPYKKRTSHGMILAKGGEKMSKSKGNVINPDNIVEEYSADILRVYEMFMGPFDQPVEWDTQGLEGIRRFLDKVWGLQENLGEEKTSKEILRILHKTIKKVSEDIEGLRFNTAVSSLMILTNELTKQEKVVKGIFEKLIILLAPFAPHFAEEVWKNLENKNSVFENAWPKYDKDLAKDEEIDLIIQVNGKVRDTIKAPADISEEEAKHVALNNEKVKKWIEGKEIKKVIFVEGKLINIVV